MGMIYCRGCGHQIHESAVSCPKCGAPNGVTGGGANVKTEDVPDGVKGWSWGAFLLSFIWAIGNRTWIGLLAIIPYVGFIMAIILGIKGREWAWKNKQWESIEQFNAVQRKWSIWGVAIVVGIFVLGVVAAISIPAYQGYVERAKERSVSTYSNDDFDAVVSEPVQLSPGAIEATSGEPSIEGGLYEDVASEGPSFDCAKASTEIEQSICSDSELAALDLRLSKAYKELLPVYEDKQAFKAEQVAWIKQRNTCDSVECLKGSYQGRVEDLEGALRYLSKPEEFR